MMSRNLVEEFRKQSIEEPRPKLLYHYTSIQAFKSIVDNNEIWATSAEHLISDPSEITIAKTIASKLLIEKKEEFKDKQELYEKCKKTIEDSDRLKEFYCICSFTEEKDLLSQWRAYCPDGGVSIGFSIPKISDNDIYLAVRDGSYHTDTYAHENCIYKCIYEPDEQERKMRELFVFLLERTEYTGQLGSFFWNMIKTFSYTFKHKSFKEEKEWRLCYITFDDKLKYRTKHSTLIPYLPFMMVDKNDKTLIKEIMIGPSRDKENLRKSVSMYLKDSEISVNKTDTPFQPS